MKLTAGRACSLQILHVSDRDAIVLVHDVVLTFLLPTDSLCQSASVTNELKLVRYIGSDSVHVRQAVVIHADNKPSTSQCTLAVWTSNDDLCIL